MTTNQFDDDMPAEEREAQLAEQQARQGQGQGQEPGRGNDGAAGHGEVIGAGAPGSEGQIKDPDQWVTGDQPMTDAQRGYLDSLAKQAGETLPADLTKAEASEHIDRLQDETGRTSTGQSDQAGAGSRHGRDDEAQGHS